MGKRLLMVDEAQDLSNAQRALIMKSVRQDGRVFIVGDPNQSIYGFSGADTDSFKRTTDLFSADVYPMTLTRRCAQVITHHAAQVVPTFRCPPDKPRGAIVWLPEERAVGALQSGDLVACRVKAPLVGLLMDLLLENKPATILGNDIGKSFIVILERMEKRADYAFDRLAKVIDTYVKERIEIFERKGDDMGREALEDQIEAMKFILTAAEERGKMTSMDALKAFITSLFSDDATGKIILCTAHKSKGLEANRVFILAPERLPMYHPRMGMDDLQQEENLDYVVRSRARETLVILTNKSYLDQLDKRKEKMPAYAQVGFEGKPELMDLSAPAAQRIIIERETTPQLPAPAQLQLPAPLPVPTAADLVIPAPVQLLLPASVPAPLPPHAPDGGSVELSPPTPEPVLVVKAQVPTTPTDSEMFDLLSRIAAWDVSTHKHSDLLKLIDQARALVKKHGTEQLAA